MEKVEWDDYFMTLVYLVAMRSKDESTHIGAVVVGPDNEIRSTGYNSFPRGLIDDKPERQKRPEKYFWFAHAERNAIYNAAMVGGAPLKGCRMYTNGVPCNDCAFGVVNAGINEVIVDKSWDDNNYAQWKEHAERTRVMFKEAGVSLRYWEGELLKVHKFRSGEKFF
jgi:dCMP deaminase